MENRKAKSLYGTISADWFTSFRLQPLNLVAKYLVTCQVIPVWAFNLSLAASSVCRRLKVRFLYSDGRDKLVGMSEVNHHSDQCKFTVNSNSSLTGLEVLKDKKPTSRSHVLILHHDNSYDAADALRITEDLTRNGICCISHHLEYSKILEMGEKDWLASSLLRCYCVLLICTKAFWDASKGRNESHFIVCQRLIAEAVKCLSCVTCDGVHSFPIIRKASDRTFIPDCVKDCEWFQLPSESQWTELISTIRQRLITIRKTVEVNNII